MIRRLLPFLLLLLIPAAAHAQVTVTGHILNPDGSVPKNAKACFSLLGFTPQVPKVTGTGVVVNQKTFCVNSNPTTGAFTTPLYPNFAISPSQTFWRVDYMVNGIQQSSATYNVTTNPFNLDSASPTVTFPPPPSFIQGSRMFEFKQGTPSTHWAIPHDFGDLNIVPACYDINGKWILWDSLVETDINTTTVSFTSPQAGSCTIISGGNVGTTGAASNAVITNPNATQVINGAPLTVQTALNATGGGAFLGTFTGPTSFSNLNGTMHAAGMKCDSTTDDSAALQTTLAAASPGTRVTLPVGTCRISPNLVSIPDGVWLQGTGKTTTTLQLASAANDSSHPLLSIAGPTGNVTISDLTLDGNKAGQTSGNNIIGTGAGVTGSLSNFRLHDSRLINAYKCAVSLITTGTNVVFQADISDNDFETNSVATGQSFTEQAPVYGDICINSPLGLRVHHNKDTNSSGDFVIFGPGGDGTTRAGGTPGLVFGGVVIDHNITYGTNGFAVALAGTGSSAVIDGNWFNQPQAWENVIDLSLWTGTVTSNNIIAAGTCASGCAGIGDAPPSNGAVVNGNIIYGNPTATGVGGAQNNSCIVMGGTDVQITNNFCSNPGAGGIVIGVAAGQAATGGVISGNTVKNANRATGSFPGHPGIDFFLNAGSSVSNWTVKGNHLYDDQVTKTQQFGIALGTFGQQTGFTNITIEGNDVRGNAADGILLPAANFSGANGIVIRGNPGFDPMTDEPVDLFLQTGNIAGGVYTIRPGEVSYFARISVDEVITQAATGSSTLPSVSVTWTDGDNGQVQSATVTPTGATGNSLTTGAHGTIFIRPQANSSINFGTSGYASSGATPMQYALHIRAEIVN